MSRYLSLLWLVIIAFIGGCTSTCDAPVAGAAYTGPQYTIGIVQFDNKAPAIVSGVGEAVATILRTQLETAGLNAIPLDIRALKEADKSKALQRSDAVKIGKMDTNNGFDELDFRLSGAITAYSEIEEGMVAAVSQKKSVVAHVAVDYALIEATTGMPLVAESGAGEYRKTTAGVLDPTARSSFDPNLRDGALRNALAKITVKVIRKLGSMPFQGKLLAVDGPSLVLKAGRRSRLKEGTQLAVYRVSKALVDPDNGQVLGYRESKIGVIQISNHLNENLSSATVVSGSGFHAGDVVKPMPMP